MHEYDLIADWYATDRRYPVGLPEVTALSASLPGIPADSRVLDIGCGNGWPLTRALVDAGHRVVGLDSSSRMLAHYRVNMPGTPAVRGRAQECAFAGQVFDAAIAWGILFHLTQPDQASAIASIARVLKPGAPFLFTAGDVDGPDAHEGTMNGVVFRYYSFSVDGYRTLLGEHGLRLVDVHKDEGQNIYYLATKER